MALQVWLPLNGNLKNQGLSRITMTNSGATVVNSGKIGKCYSFNGTSSYLITDFKPAEIVPNEMSFCCWVKLNALNKAHTLFCSRTEIGAGLSVFIVSANKLRFDNGNNSENSSNQTTFDYTFAANIWYHIAVVQTKTQKKLYINGTLQQSINKASANLGNNTATKASIGASGTNNADNNYLNGYLNDIRIYDHALSAQEVKEISKGLVLHYKLDGGPTCLPRNLLLNSKKDAGQSHTTYDIADFNISESLVNGYNYTIIAKINTSSEKKSVAFFHSGGSLKMGEWQPISTDGIYKVGFTANSNMANQTSGSGYGFCRVYISNNSGTGQGSTTLSGTANIEWITLYRGSGDSIYTPAEEYDGICYDSSGYGNNGNTIGTLVIGISGPRYNSHLYMKNLNSDNRIEVPINFLTDQLTISFWVKLEAKRGQVLFAMPTTQCCLNSAGTHFYINANAAPGYSASNVNIDQWYFFTIVKNNTSYSFYINGSQIQASGGNNNWTHNGNKLYLLNRNYNNSYAANAHLSDFRIYTTTFSNEEIQKLYNTSGVIDNNGNLYTRELVE